MQATFRRLRDRSRRFRGHVLHRALVLTELHGAQTASDTPRPLFPSNLYFIIPSFPSSWSSVPRQQAARPSACFGSLSRRPLRPSHLCLWLLAAAFLFHTSILTAIDRYVQQTFTIRLIALRYQYGIAASQIFRSHWRRGKLPARGAAVECRSDGSVHPDSGSGSRTGVQTFRSAAARRETECSRQTVSGRCPSHPSRRQ